MTDRTPAHLTDMLQFVQELRSLVAGLTVTEFLYGCLIWMPPGEQEEFVSCCEEVGCVLIFGLDCMVRLVSQARPLAPMHIR